LPAQAAGAAKQGRHEGGGFEERRLEVAGSEAGAKAAALRTLVEFDARFYDAERFEKNE